MRLTPLIASAFILSACSTPTITGNEQGGLADHNAFNQQDAFRAADQHCQRFMKRARIRQVVEGEYVYQFTFDCVTP